MPHLDSRQILTALPYAIMILNVSGDILEVYNAGLFQAGQNLLLSIESADRESLLRALQAASMQQVSTSDLTVLN